MHFWIDKRSPYGFGRGARVSGSGFGQYPRRCRPSKPWSQTNRNAVTTPTSAEAAHVEALSHHHHHHHHAAAAADPSDVSSPSYFKWSLWAIAIALSTILVYIICAKLLHEHQLFTFCALLAVFFVLGVCTVSSMFRRTEQQPVATAAVPMPQDSTSSRAAGGGGNEDQQQRHRQHHQNPQTHHNHSTSTLEYPNYGPDNRSPSISIHNLAESPTPTYHNNHHNNHNQV